MVCSSYLFYPTKNTVINVRFALVGESGTSITA